MSQRTFSVSMTQRVSDMLVGHLLGHFRAGHAQEDLCFALWYPSSGRSRETALLHHAILPCEPDRDLHGNASFNGSYFDRVIEQALAADAGIAFLHSHPSEGWQGMSLDDVIAEERLAPRVLGATGLPLVGLTVGTDGAWSARYWNRVGRGQYERNWCSNVRTVGSIYEATFAPMLVAPVVAREELRRTFSAWGATKQTTLTRLRVGVVGLGSVGALVSEALVRMGIEHLMLIDHDRVKVHNLDRLLHATADDIGRLKVDVAAERLRLNATAANVQVEALALSITTPEGFKAALDCDVLFSCVDRPWPRNVLNHIAYSHLIPVIDGGVRVRVSNGGRLKGAEWKAHIAAPERSCLECLRQFDPADVSLERSGLLEDPTYVAGLSSDHFVNQNENVFGFSMNAAGLQILQLLSMVVAPSEVGDIGQQTYHFTTGTLDRSESGHCRNTCLYPTIEGLGDKSGVNFLASTTSMS